MQYKELFELAQQKGYRISFAGDISDTGLIQVGDYLWGDEEEAKRSYSQEQLLMVSYLEMCRMQKWLREEHKIIVIVRPFNLGVSYFCSILSNELDRDFTVGTDGTYTYEQALLEGIYESIKLLASL